MTFSVDRSVSWLGYSFDGLDNVTVSGNATLGGLSCGVHNVTVYAKDSFGNVGALETITFTINKLEPEPFQASIVEALLGYQLPLWV